MILIQAKNLFKKKEYLNFFNLVSSITIIQDLATIHKISGIQLANWIFTTSKQIYSTSNVVDNILFEIPSTGLTALLNHNNNNSFKVLIELNKDSTYPPKNFEFELALKIKKYNHKLYHPVPSSITYWTTTTPIFPKYNPDNPTSLLFTFKNKHPNAIKFVQFVINMGSIEPFYVKEAKLFKNKQLIKYYDKYSHLFTYDKVTYNYKVFPSKLGTISFDNWVTNNPINSSTLAIGKDDVITIEVILSPNLKKKNINTIFLWGIFSQNREIESYVEYTEKE
jgi:hypothetical protein